MLWRYLRALSNFVQETGQVYRFEDSLQGRAPTERPHVNSPLSAFQGPFAPLAADLLRETLVETPEPEQKQHVQTLLSLLHFITDSGQSADVEDFFLHQLDYAPVAIAHFASHEEAEAWLHGSAEPPSPTRILIGDDYYQFWYMREDSTRSMSRDFPIEPALEALTARGIPPQAPSFATRAEAEEWLRSHPADPYAFVTIAGVSFFAVYHRRLKRHSLHPVASTLQAWEERKKAVEREAALEAAARTDEGLE